MKRSSYIQKITVPILIVVGVVIVYTYVFSPKEFKENTPLLNLRIATSNTPLSAPLIIADHLDLFKKNGITVTLVPCSGGVECVNRLFNAETDFATASESVAMFDSFKRNDFSILTTFVDSDNDLKLLTTNELKIKRISDLVGKKVGVVKASASEFYLYSILLINGIEPDLVEKVYVEPDELPEKLYAREVDAISAWEPNGYLTSLNTESYVKNIGAQGVYHLTFNLISMRSYLVSNKKQVKAILTSLDQAIEWINRNQDESMKIVSDNLGLEYKQLKWTWNDYSFRLSLNNSLLSNLQMQARWAKNAKLVEGDIPDYRQFIATDIMAEYIRGFD